MGVEDAGSGTLDVGEDAGEEEGCVVVEGDVVAEENVAVPEVEAVVSDP